MMKLLALAVILSLCALSGGAELIHNPAFYNPKQVSTGQTAGLKKYGIRMKTGVLPFGWTVSCNSLKVVDGLIDSQKIKDRMSLHFSSVHGEIIFYNHMRIPLEKFGSQEWALCLGIHGKGEVTPVAYGYDANGKCVYFHRFQRIMLHRKQFPLPVFIRKQDFSVKNAVAVAIGIAVKGTASVYAIELKDMAPEEIRKITEQRRREQQAYLLQNGSFESAGGWVLKKHDGAEGYMKIIDGGRTGKKSLLLVKSNGEGFLQLAAANPVKVNGGHHYVFRGYFQTQTSKLDSLLLFRVAKTEEDRNFRYDDVDRSQGFPAQSLLINSNAGEWVKRVVSHRPKQDGEIYLNLILTGNPAEVRIDDLELSPDNYTRPAPADLTKRTEFPYTREQVYEILGNRKNDEAFLHRNGDRMELLLNGKAVLPAMYKPEWFQSDYVYNRYLEFGQAGVPFALRTIQLSSGKTDRGVVLGPGQYDFAKLEEVVMYALRQNPYARLVIDYGLNEPYPGWGQAHPDELWRNEKGEFGWGVWGNCEGFVSDFSQIKLTGLRASWIPWPFGSYSSRSYRDAHIRSVTEITQYLMQSPVGKAIVGFHIGGGHDAQFQYFRPDYSQPAVESFRDFLRMKYENIGELNRRTGSCFHDFQEIAIPSSWIFRQAKTPFNHGIAADYKAFQRHESWRLKHALADAVRGAAGKRIFVSAYGLPLEYHAGTFVRHTGGVDLFVVPSWYPFRQMGYPIGAKPDATFADHGKMWLNEMDLRTWTEPAKSEIRDMWLGAALDLPYWKSVHRKFAGVALAHHSAWWYYSMYRYFDRPEVMAEIKNAMAAAGRLKSVPGNHFRPEVCVVRSERGDDILSATFSSDANTVIFPWQLMQMEMSGVPYDLHDLHDVMNREELQDYKMYVFLHTAELSRVERRKIEQLKKAGKMLVFLYNSGWFDEVGGESGNITDLTSFPVSSEPHYGRASALLQKHPLTTGLNPLISGGDLLLSMLAVRGMSPHYQAYQVFRIKEAKPDEILARYTDGSIAAAIRGNVVYSAAPFSLSAGLFHRLAERSGAFCVAAPGQSIHMNGSFISLHGTTPGDCILNLPSGVNQVTDLFSGENFQIKNGKFTLKVKNGESYWLMMSNSRQ